MRKIFKKFGFWILVFGFLFSLSGNTGREAYAQSVTTPVISVSAPFAGADWVQGKQYDILWAQQNTERVDIGWGDCQICTTWLVTDYGVDVNASSGKYTWTVPENAALGDQYYITVVGKKASVIADPAFSPQFRIVENPELRPDLVIESASLGIRSADTQQTFRAQELTDKDDAWARLWVVNRGRRPSGEWQYAVSITGEAGSAQSARYRSLNAGEGIEVFYHLGIRNAGSKDVLFFADPGSEIFELDEGNNGFRKVFLIKETGNKPDLILHSVMTQTDKDGVVSELAMTVRATNLSPIGDPIVARVKVETLGRDYRREYDRLLIPTVNTVLGLPGSPWPSGNYVVEVALDPDNRIEEESETNNKILAAVVMGQYVGFGQTPQVTTNKDEVPQTETSFETLTPTPSASQTTEPVSEIQPVAVNPALVKRLKGRILLQTEGRGELWYVDPVSGGRFYVTNGASAMDVLRKKGLGIRNADLAKIPVGIPARLTGTDEDSDGLEDSFEDALGTDAHNTDTDGDGFSDTEEVRSGYNPTGIGRLTGDTRLTARLEGRIVLQVEGRGQAWYIYRGKRYYLKGGDMTVEILKQFMLGVRNNDLAQIPQAE